MAATVPPSSRGSATREVSIESCGTAGMKITTPEYTDYVFVSDTRISEQLDDVHFIGKSGWIRRDARGEIRAVMAEGERIEAFGITITGRGPWTYNADGSAQAQRHRHAAAGVDDVERVPKYEDHIWIILLLNHKDAKTPKTMSAFGYHIIR